MISAPRFKNNVESYLDGRSPNSRYASFDYCFNYFQSFRADKSRALVDPKNLQLSCLHLGFYLASWGMYRGSSLLLKRSMICLAPVIEAIAHIDVHVWNIDAHRYSDENMQRLLDTGEALRSAHGSKMSDALVTKIMLGVFGNVPAFDTYFKRGFHASKFGPKALQRIRDFYEDNATLVDSHREPALDFGNRKRVQRRYTRAKVIDMAFFIEGQ